MKVCFYHEEFDRDVSSGTQHSLDQWQQLLSAFNVKTVAIINKTEDKVQLTDQNIKQKEYKSLEEFLDDKEGHAVFSSPRGNINYKDFNYKSIDWIIIGGSEQMPKDGIKICEGELYPREAAAIILAEAVWQLR